MSNSNSSKQILLSVIGIAILVIAVVGVAFAFFNYTRTGATNTIKVGRISFVSKNEQTITLNNLFPIDPSNTSDLNDPTKVGTYSIDIKGDTDYVDGIEYLVSATDANIYTTEGQVVPITLDFTVNSLGDPSANYFTERESKDTLIYKKLIGDTLVGDQMLLVGYIPQNNPTGTDDGVDGSITIKAYLDKNKILISDTYDGTESDNMGTPNSMAQGKTVITTGEWNALQTNGVSFKVKVEANEGIWVNGSLEEIMKKENYSETLERGVRDNENSDYVQNETPGIDFGAVSSNTNGKGVYMRAGTENDVYPILYYRGEIEDNNVIFADKCWKIVRTTDTGGIKLIYNGENSGTIDNSNCNNTGTNTFISINETSYFPFSGSNMSNSIAYNGYMYGTVYEYSTENWTSGAYFGSNFIWDGTNYKLVDATVTTPDTTHHFSCNQADATAYCNELRYVYYVIGNTKYYITLTDGDGIEEAFAKMQTNTNDSNAKDKIDTWYASNMTTYTNILEDTIWCNDRSIEDNNNGWNPNGGDLSNYLYYGAGLRSNYATESLVRNQPTLTCANKNDRFTVSNVNGNGTLTYPVAMLTEDEIVMAGGKAGTMNATYYLASGNWYWTLSPLRFEHDGAFGFGVSNVGQIDSGYVHGTGGLRPAISIKPGQLITKGTGTVDDPYVIE